MNDLELVEPEDAVPDIYADGIGAVELLAGDNIRVIYFRWTRRQGSDALEPTICANIIRPRAGVGNLLEMLETATRRRSGVD